MILAVAILLQTVTATPIPPPAPIVVTEVVQAPGRTAADLYSAALAWAPDATQNKDAGMLVRRVVEPWDAPALLARTLLSGAISYTVTVEVKDGRYRYTVGPFVHEPSTAPGYGTVTDAEQAPSSGVASAGSDRKNWADLQRVARERGAAVAATLKPAMAKPAAEW